MDDKTAKLFPEINPNVEELVERDNAIDSENVIVENIDNKTEVKNMFVNKKNKIIKKRTKRTRYNRQKSNKRRKAIIQFFKNKS